MYGTQMYPVTNVCKCTNVRVAQISDTENNQKQTDHRSVMDRVYLGSFVQTTTESVRS